jgi:hypothetical protein
METFRYRQPTVGQPYIDIVEGEHPKALIDRFAGKFLVICCFGSSQIGPGRTALDALHKHAHLFDATKKNFLGIAVDPRQMIENLPQGGLFYYLDRDGLVSRQCGAAPLDSVPLGTQYRVTWTVVDPTLHVLAHFHTGVDAADCDAVFAFVRDLPEPQAFASCEIPAPILVLPNLFDHALCDKLVALYEDGRPRDSGFMRDNVEIFDYSFKRRRDYFVEDEAIKAMVVKRISLCVIPEIRKLFFMSITRMERYLVGCYSADDEAHFNPHRDNGQAVTAHRRYALSIALNEDYEGGELMFPEYNQRPHKVPKGWCVVFPCAILHAVTRVTSGRRYAFLPFLYDEAAEKMKVSGA